MVSTLDFESNDPGSNPGRTFSFFPFFWPFGTIPKMFCVALATAARAPPATLNPRGGGGALARACFGCEGVGGGRWLLRPDNTVLCVCLVLRSLE
jgi:hypothetical protein